MDRRSVIHGLGTGSALVIGLSLAGCTSLGASDPESENVEGTLIEMTDDSRFEPSAVTVSPNETVVWRTVGYAPHTVTAYENEIPPDAAYFASGGFSSEAAARGGASDGNGVIDRGEEYEHTFQEPGTYAYFCIPHEHGGMTGTITVASPEDAGQGGE